MKFKDFINESKIDNIREKKMYDVTKLLIGKGFRLKSKTANKWVFVAKDQNNATVAITYNQLKNNYEWKWDQGDYHKAGEGISGLIKEMFGTSYAGSFRH